jgi:putative membrane protein
MQSSVERTKPRTLRQYVGVAARGFCMGAADVVPGVSGGTMAFILGIYEELLHAIHTINLDFVRRLLSLRWREALAHIPWRFMLALGLGIGAAILALARSISWALEHHPSLVWAFFFGLVLASIVTVRKRVRRWTLPVILSAALAALGAYALVGLTPAKTPDAPWFLFLSGALAICAMILPGISGAFILVLLGKYHTVLDAVVTRDVVTLAIVAAGCVVGLLSFARLLRWLFQHYHDLVVAMLLGLMLGSLRKVWPWKETQTALADSGGTENVLQGFNNVLPADLTPETLLAVSLMLLGFGLIIGMERLNARQTSRAVMEEQAA